MDIETLRMLERIIVVFGGILSVFLGYRLFLLADTKSDSDGTFRLADVFDAGFKRVGPGIFFAFFGASVLYSSLHHRLETKASIALETAGQRVKDATTVGETKKLGIWKWDSFLKQAAENLEANDAVSKAEQRLRALEGKILTSKDIASVLGELKSLKIEYNTTVENINPWLSPSWIEQWQSQQRRGLTPG
jgi:hypothetical protein